MVSAAATTTGHGEPGSSGESLGHPRSECGGEMKLLDKDLQRELLIRLREHYPEIVDLQPLDLWNRKGFHRNAFYLDAHGLIKRVAARMDVTNSPNLMLTARLTEKGVDFLEEDGGLGAILNKVTVSLDQESLRALLAARIEASTLPAPKKAKFLSMLGSFTGKAAERAILCLIEQALKRPESIAAAFKMLQQ